MAKRVNVDCRFDADGIVYVQRVMLEGAWLPVEQGRQWVDEAGRHVLIMLPTRQVRELVLSAQTLSWEILPHRGGWHVV